ncbi:voltage-dependent chloride channel 1, chloroplastic-like [Gastrolobium bilobum]|uniref:voltage-dependent chloride channel 1, chloroplastic-like n=1 Tax=Gastrolobium bilobum TaxID=150636 RepID=UPI002AB19FC4|nr:voltage-dependent chloride channel 1, chloroplastic-like [Gastrolobium bilobum]
MYHHPRIQIKPKTSTTLSSQFTPKCHHLNNYNNNLHSFKPHKTNFKFKPTNSTPNPTPTQTLISIFRSIPDWADAIKERGMQKNRTLYTHPNWLNHRSSRRHLRHFLSSLSSRVILSLIPPVIAFTAFAAAIAAYNSAVLLHFLPEFFPILRASSLPYQLTAPALALLLVFRTEASYSRFVEGKKAWTKVIAGAHDFVRQVMAAVDTPSDFPIKKLLLQYIMAFPLVLKCHVLYGSDVRRDLQHVLEIDDLALIINAEHRPRCIIEFISQSIRLLKLEESRRNVLESKISCFHEGIGICEQLMGIPIPLSYTRLTSRFLVLWHLTLPVILWDDCHWVVVPATFISAASLFCIEEVGVLIEEPFPMLALDEICQKALKDIQEAIATESLIRAQLVAKRNYHSKSKEHSPNGWPNS